MTSGTDTVKGAALFVGHDLSGWCMFIGELHAIDNVNAICAALVQVDSGLAAIGDQDPGLFWFHGVISDCRCLQISTDCGKTL